MKKTYNIFKIFILFIISLFLFSCKATPEEEPKEKEKLALDEISIEHEEKFGGFYVKMTIDEFNQFGFNYGDSVTIKLSNGFELVDIPYYNGYYSDTEAPLLVAYPGYPYIKACYNNGGDMYLIANLKEADTASITLYEARKYLDIQEAMDIHYSDIQGDQSDEVFGNFRAVNVGTLKENILYRSASPCDNQHNRASVVDRLIADAKIKTIINLSDNEEELINHINKEDFNSPYFLSIYNEGNVIPLSMSMAYKTESFEQKLATGLRKMIEKDGPYLVHCVEGKDRTGYVCMVLEALASTSYDEIISDYMITYDNYYQVNISNNPTKYNILKEKYIDEMLKWFIGNNDIDLRTVDYGYYAKEYLKRIGLNEDEITALINKIVKDEKENIEKNIDDLKNDLNELINSYYLNDSRYYSEYVHFEVGDIKVNYSIKMILDEIYIEELSNGLHIIKEENGYVYLYYYTNNPYFLHRRFISMKDDFLASETTEEEDIEEYLFDPLSIDGTEITLEDDTYIVKGLISSLDLGIKYQSDFYVNNNDYYELRIKEDNGILSMQISFNIIINNKSEDFDLSYSISRKEFPILDTSLIYDETPTHIDEVTKESNLTESFIPTCVLEGKRYGFYLVHLDKGLYYFDIKGTSDLPIYGKYEVVLCDKYYKAVELGQVINYKEFKAGRNHFFEVYESGDYYLTFKCDDREDYYYKLKKITYPLHDKMDLSNISGSITGLFDFYEVEYNSNNFGAVNLTNQGESDVYILYNDTRKTTVNELSFLTLKPGVTMSIPLFNDPQKNKFYITSRVAMTLNDNRIDPSYDFQLDAQMEEYDNKVYNISLDNKVSFTVYKSGVVQGLITISNSGYYTISSSQMGASAHIENGDKYIIYNGLIDVWYLEPGVYIVDFQLSDGYYFNRLESEFQLEVRNIE